MRAVLNGKSEDCHVLVSAQGHYRCYSVVICQKSCLYHEDKIKNGSKILSFTLHY